MFLFAVGTFGAGHALAAPGAADPSFGNAGKRVQLVGQGMHQRAVTFAIDRAGRTLAILTTAPGGPSSLARFAVDGELDRDFGEGGFVTDANTSWTAVSLDDEGRILVAGSHGSTVSISRFSSEGDFDSTFADGGTWSTDLLPLTDSYHGEPKVDPKLVALAVLEDGSVAAAGTVAACNFDYGGFYEHKGQVPCPGFAAIRLDESGSLDPGFGENGIRLLALPHRDPTAGVLPDGRFLFLGGYEEDSEDDGIDYQLVRRIVDPQGSVSAPAADTIVYSPSLTASHGEVTTDSHNRILVAVGQQILRMDSSGALDPTFDENGVVTIDNGPTWNHYRRGRIDLSGIAVDDADRVLVTGNAFRNRVRTAYVARLRVDGSADPTFSNDGLAGTWSAPSKLGPAAFKEPGPKARVDDENRIIVGGAMATTAGVRSAFARRSGGSIPEPRCMGERPTYLGGKGADVVGGIGQGVIITGAGNDVVKLGFYAKICTGSGNDTVHVGGLTRVALGSGDDVAVPHPRESGKDVVSGGPGNDRIRTGKGNDLLLGGAGRDTLAGGIGDDTLRGGAGGDRLFGNRGNDHLFGGGGRDRLDAGPAGREELVYSVRNERIRLRLYRYRGAMVRGDYRLSMTCGSQGGYSVGTGFRESRRINPKTGRFSFQDSANGDWDTFDMKLVGRLKGSTVFGRVRYVDTTSWPGCWTGQSRGDAWIQFRARLLPVVRQTVRQ